MADRQIANTVAATNTVSDPCVVDRGSKPEPVTGPRRRRWVLNVYYIYLRFARSTCFSIFYDFK